MNTTRSIVAVVAALTANAALAGPTVALGSTLGQGLGLTALGGTLGVTLAFVLGAPLGGVLPLASIGLLTVSAASLVAGIYIVKRRKPR